MFLSRSNLFRFFAARFAQKYSGYLEEFFFRILFFLVTRGYRRWYASFGITQELAVTIEKNLPIETMAMMLMPTEIDEETADVELNAGSEPSRIKKRRSTVACHRFERNDEVLEDHEGNEVNLSEFSSAAASSEVVNLSESGCSGLQTTAEASLKNTNATEAGFSAIQSIENSSTAATAHSLISIRRQSLYFDLSEIKEVDESSVSVLPKEENVAECAASSFAPAIQSEMVSAAVPPSILKRRQSTFDDVLDSSTPKRRKSVSFDLKEANDEEIDLEKENAGPSSNSAAPSETLVQGHDGEMEPKIPLRDQNGQGSRLVPELLPIATAAPKKWSTLTEFVQYHQERLKETMPKKF